MIYLIFLLSQVTFTTAATDPFMDACQEKTAVRGKTVSKIFCENLKSRFFKNNADLEVIQPTVVNAPKLPLDSKTRMVFLKNPKALSQLAYCYFLHRGWFKLDQLSPVDLYKMASGFSVIKTELTDYLKWINTPDGLHCQNKVKKDLGLPLLNLEKELGNSLALITFNPVGAMDETLSLPKITEEAKLTLNHERIHVHQVQCTALTEIAKSTWSKLKPTEQQKIKTQHPEYDWTKPETAVRENFAFQYEKNPEKILKLTKQCKF